MEILESVVQWRGLGWQIEVGRRAVGMGEEEREIKGVGKEIWSGGEWRWATSGGNGARRREKDERP